MTFWRILWTLLWFGGLALFAILSVIITVQGARDLKTLLRDLRGESSQPRDGGNG